MVEVDRIRLGLKAGDFDNLLFLKPNRSEAGHAAHLKRVVTVRPDIHANLVTGIT